MIILQVKYQFDIVGVKSKNTDIFQEHIHLFMILFIEKEEKKNPLECV